MRVGYRLARLSIYAKQLLLRAGLGDHPVVAGLTRFLKRRVFHRFYDTSRPIAEVTLEGLRVRLPSRLLKFYALRPWEPLTHRRMRRWLRPGMRCLDVGANFGFFTLLTARLVGPRGRVWAVEPTRDNLELLRENLQLNHAEQVEVVACAAGGEPARRRFFLTDATDTHSFYPHPFKTLVAVEEVEQRRVDDLVEGPLDLIKIDVEGAELEVLAGMAETLSASPSARLIVEWNPPCQQAAGHAAEELPEALADLGFKLRVLDEHSGRERTVEETLALLRSGELPEGWFGNLWAER